MPGLWLPSPAVAADEDEVDFQYSHYQESKRNLFGNRSRFAPIEVDSLHGSARVKLTDRVKFAFNYLQDTWGGATPISTSPEAFGGNSGYNGSGGFQDNEAVKSGATPYIATDGFLDRNLRPLSLDRLTGNATPNDKLVHTLAEASPETRKQGDFRLTYEWDEAAIDVGGGISVENDYESRFGNLNGRMDFNNKQTTANLGLSYTNSDTNAVLDHDSSAYLYETDGTLLPSFYNTTHKGNVLTSDILPNAFNRLTGNRQDWGVVLGLTQVLNKNATLSGELGYQRSTGYLSNPYKAVTVAFIDPTQQEGCDVTAIGGFCAGIRNILEERPEVRNQWTGSLGLSQFIEGVDAALHANYRIFTDDWGITSHTFEADWVQPLGAGWTVTPRIRYYSQDQADFYTPYLITKQAQYGAPAKDSQGRDVYYDRFTGNFANKYYLDEATGEWTDGNGNSVTDKVNNGVIAPTNATPFDHNKLAPVNRPDSFTKYYSSDQRLSGYGALSGGVTVTKQFATGVALDLGFEYYTHQGSLKLGGGGEGNYADFDYWVANAALKVNLETMALGMGNESSGHSIHHHHDHGAHAPAGVMFDHMLNKAGEWMLGYRYQYSSHGGTMLDGTNPVSDAAIIANGCTPDQYCFLTPSNMSMHMHMAEIMYAPADWLTLMLMPQFMDMDMGMRELSGDKVIPEQPANIGDHIVHHSQNSHETGGIGDLGMYAMVKLFDNDSHHIHATAGLSAPTGDVDIHLRRNHQLDGGFIHYGMQLGSGTWDFKPSITYAGHIDEWSWGAQASGTVRMENKNKSGYALGDLFQCTVWGGYNLTPWLTATVRGIYTLQGRVHGQFFGSDAQFVDPVAVDENGQPKLSSILKFGPMDYPQNYGGRYWDVGFGLSATMPSGALAGNRVSVEWLQPVEDDVNGYQLERTGTLSATWSLAF